MLHLVSFSTINCVLGDQLPPKTDHGILGERAPKCRCRNEVRENECGEVDLVGNCIEIDEALARELDFIYFGDDSDESDDSDSDFEI